MDYINKKITLDNGKTYIVIEQVDYNEGIYLYIVNIKDEDDTRFVEIKDDSIYPIKNSLFDEKIFPLFYEKIKK